MGATYRDRCLTPYIQSFKNHIVFKDELLPVINMNLVHFSFFFLFLKTILLS